MCLCAVKKLLTHSLTSAPHSEITVADKCLWFKGYVGG